MPRKRTPVFESENNPLAIQLAVAMEFRGLNRTSLSERIGVKRQTIGYYLSGESQPNADTLAKLAEALDISSDWLLGLSDNCNISTKDNLRGLLSDQTIASISVEAMTGETSKTGFINYAFSKSEQLDSLIAALKMWHEFSNEDGQNDVIISTDITLEDSLEHTAKEKAMRSIVEHYFWKLFENYKPMEDSGNG